MPVIPMIPRICPNCGSPSVREVAYAVSTAPLHRQRMGGILVGGPVLAHQFAHRYDCASCRSQWT